MIVIMCAQQLFRAIENDDVSYVQRAVKNLGANARQMKNRSGDDMMYVAVSHSHSSIVDILLEANFPVDTRNESYETPLFMACRRGDLNIASKLLDSGANIHTVDDHMQNPLIMACIGGNIALVQMLLDAGANPNEIDESEGNWGAYRWADVHGYENICNLLKARGAIVPHN